MSPALRDLLESHVVASLLKQQRLFAALGDEVEWAADLDAGTFTAAGFTFPADVIGTQSLKVETFVWGWANPSIPRFETAERLRRLGEERGIPELTDDGELPPAALEAGTASLIASGVAELDAYFLGVAGGRAVAFALRDEGLRRRPVPLVGLASAFFEVASVVEFSHRRAFAHYLARPLPEVPAAVEGGRAVLRGRGETATVAFDAEGRVAELRVEAAGAG